MLVWGYEGDGNAGVGDVGGVVVVKAVYGYVGGTRGPGIVSSAVDVLGMREVHGVRGVGGVCEMCMCMCLAWDSARWEWIRRLVLGYTSPVGTGGVLDVCLYLGCGGVGGLGGELIRSLDQDLEG